MSTRLYDALREIPDYRDPRGVRYKLADLHFMMICAILCGMRNAVEIVEYISYRIDDFKKILDVKSVPSHDTISRVYIHTDWTYLTKHLQDWLECNYPEKSRLYQGRRVYHIDGKAIRASADKGNGEKAPYQLNFQEEGKSIGIRSLSISEKENEIRRIPDMLDFLDLADAIVTIDAIGCQRKIMKKILSKGGHFMIPIKDNQTALLESVQSEKNRLILTGKWEGLPSFRLQKLEHGRCETYSLRIIENTEFLLDEFGADDEFMSIARIGVIEKTSVDKITKEKTVTESYIATDLCDIEPENFLGIKLSHWNIEAQHWILDVQLDEDRQRQRLGNSKTNSTAFRRFLMALAKNPEHPKWTVSKFMICCQNRFDEMVNTLLKMGNTEE